MTIKKSDSIIIDKMSHLLKMALMNYIIDTETSGSSKEDRIISLAIGTFENNMLNHLKIEMFNPGVQIKDGSRWVHNISNSMVKDKLRFANSTMFNEIKSIFSNKNNVIIGHAIENDLFMIAREGIECACKILDTEYCARQVFNLHKSSLRFLKNELNLNTEVLQDFTAHTADGDVMITYFVLLELLKYKTFDDLIEMTMSHTLKRSLPGRKYAKIPISEVIRKDRNYVREVYLTTTNPSLRYCLCYYLNRNKIHAKFHNAPLLNK